jgi:hypothetical protein
MLYEANTPEPGSLPGVPGEQQPTNGHVDTTKRPKNVLDTEVFDRLHAKVYDAVKPATHGERIFLTRCIQAVLEADGQWTDEETMQVLNALIASREGVKAMFRQEELINDGLPDFQVA